MPPRDPMAHTPMTHVKGMGERRAAGQDMPMATQIIRARIAARGQGLPEPIQANRTDDGRVIGGELDVACELDAALAAEAAAKAGKSGRGR